MEIINKLYCLSIPMKKFVLFIAFTVCALVAVSCGNNKSSKISGEEITEAKIELAEDVLATLDSLEQKCVEAGADFEDVIGIITSALTDEQKMVKPDYLMDPKHTHGLMSLRQKVNALAILLTERPLREAYEMPLEEIDEAIARLYVEIGSPVPLNMCKDLPVSEIVKMAYKVCKSNNELCYFWMFDNAVQYNLLYLISFNSDTFFNNITPEQYEAFNTRIYTAGKAAQQLAEYDSEIASAVAFHDKTWGFESLEEAKDTLSDINEGKAMIEKRHQDYVDYRVWVLL